MEEFRHFLQIQRDRQTGKQTSKVKIKIVLKE